MTEIGKVLKDARIQKGLTLDDLQQSTKIQKRYLLAIENQEFDQLPGDFYVRAFVKQYAEAVDLDAAALLAELTPKTQVADDSEAQGKRTQAKEAQENATKLEKLYGYLPTIIIIVAVVGILGSIWVVAWANHKKNANTQIEQSTSSVTVQSNVSSADVKASSSSQKTAAKASAKTKQTITYNSTNGSVYYYTLKNGASKNQIKLSATSRAWTAVYANGSQTWQGTLTANGSHTVTLPANTTTIKLTLGNASETSVKINNQTFNFKAQSSSSTVRTISISVK